MRAVDATRDPVLEKKPFQIGWIAPQIHRRRLDDHGGRIWLGQIRGEAVKDFLDTRLQVIRFSQAANLVLAA
jgi:hypothetical protein